MHQKLIMKLNGLNPTDIFESFCKNTAVPAFGYLINKSKSERIFWLSCILIGVAGIIYITIDISRSWSTESVYITLDASSLQITKVDFPGVAICDINKISKQRATQLANTLINGITDRDFQDTLNLVRLLGNLYDSNVYGARNFSRLQDLLNTVDNVTTERHMLLRLSSLITPCSELLLNCSWNSVSYNCMDLFQTRLTDSGFCCLFNYVRSSFEAATISGSDKTVPKRSKNFLGTGVAQGLSVTINNNISDYFYTPMATRGCLLKIFLAGDFPDLTSGSLKQIVVQEKAEVFVNVEANTLQSQKQVRSLSRKQRKCKFPDEERTAFGHYTSSNCFVSCKLKSMKSLCNCVPLLLPIVEEYNTDNGSFCNLMDIPCLNRYRGKWLRYYPSELPDNKELSLDIEDSLKCDACMPNCNEVTYAIDTNYFQFSSEDARYKNSSRIHVFSNKAYTNLYKKTVTVTWYEALSTFGGIVSILLGMSIINFVEIAVVILKLLASKLKIF